MYRKILAIHLCTGMFSLAFLAMYGWSAVQMAHRRWFGGLPDRVTRQEYTLQPELAGVRAVARLLPMRGELTNVRGSQFRIVRPGVVWVVNYEAGTGVTAVELHDSGVRGALNRIHETAGMWHDYALLNIWAAVLGAMSLGLLVLGATGLYLWFRNRRERLVGTILLVAGSGFAALLIASMRIG